MTGGRRSIAAAALVAALVAALPACRGGSPISTDPRHPIFRSAGAEFGRIRGVRLHFKSVTTHSGQGDDLVRAVFADSLRAHLAPRFGEVTEGDAAAEGGALLEVTLRVNWGSRAARYFVSFGAGRAGIDIQYDLKDPAGALLAKLHVVDTMSGGWFGGNAKELVYSAAEKWNRWFVESVLVDAPRAPPQAD